MKKLPDKAAVCEQALAGADAQMYDLRLCISGMTPRSRNAIVNLKRICETHLKGQYRLEVIDIYQQPEWRDIKCSPRQHC